MATPLHDQLAVVATAAQTTIAARVALEQATQVLNVLPVLEASNALLTQILVLLNQIVATVEP